MRSAAPGWSSGCFVRVGGVVPFSGDARHDLSRFVRSHAPRRRIGRAGDVACVLDTPAHREALQEEILDRIAGHPRTQRTMATAQLEAPDSPSRGGILDALAILSRDVRGLMEAGFQPGP
jgi:hypothetical protein